MTPKDILLAISIIVVAILIYYIIFNRTKTSSNYQNKEEWEVTWNSDGLPSNIIIHRDATEK